jgi:hypothetical protein
MRFSRPSLPAFRSSSFLLSLAASAFALAPAAFSAPLRLPITARMEASATWAENINRASSPADWTDTLRHEARATASLLTPLATGVSLITEADLGYTSVPRYVRNTTLSATARSALRWKFGLGAFAPVLSTEVSVARRDSRLIGDDSWLATGALRASQRFTDTWRASLTGDWSQNYAAHSVFDTRHHRFLGTVTYDLNDRWQLTYGRGSLWGDVTANASARIWSRALAGLITPAIGAYYPTLSSETTDSFGPGYVTYRFKARSDFWWLELAPALGRNTSLPLRYESTFTVNFVGVKYRQDLWTASILHRF